MRNLCKYKKMKENFLKLSQNVIFALVVLAAVAATLFFLPTTSEFFEYNKFTATLIIAVLALVAWAVKMILQKRTVFVRTPLDIPLLILAVIFLVSALASIDQFISLFGKHGRIWPSFFPLATLTTLYFVTTSNIRTKKQVNFILWTLVVCTLVASIVATTSYFGGFLPFDFAKIRSFNPLGIINRLALLQAFIIPLSASWAIYERDKITRTAATIITLIMIFSFILINSLPVYIGLIAGLAVLAVGAMRLKLTKAQQGSVAVLAVFTILFLVIRFVPQVAKGTLYAWIAAKDQGLTEQQQIDTPKEKAIPRKIDWDIAASAIGKRPILGTGPGTYQFVYTQLKPMQINRTDDWAIRFEKGSSDFTEIIATTGIFGILAYLLLAVAIIRYIWTLIFKSHNTLVYLPICAALIGYLVSNLFTVSSFSTAAVSIIVLALISVLVKINGEAHAYEITLEIAALKNKFAWFPLGSENQSLITAEEGAKGAKSQVLPAVFAIFVVVICAFALFHQYKAYRADYFYRQSLLSSRSNDGNKTVAMLQKAIQNNPGIDTYHRALSQTSLNALLNLSRQTELNDTQKQLIGQLVQVAIDQGKVASGYQILPLRLPGISAANVVNWETLASVYQTLIGSANGADVHATNTLIQAVSLDPQNPILHNRLGALYQRLGDLDRAQRKFEDTIIVKSDFGPAHYNLANLLIEKNGDVTKIVNALTIAKRVLPAEDPAREDIERKLETYNKKLRELQESTNKQTREAEELTTQEIKSPTPSPTPSPTSTPSLSPSL